MKLITSFTIAACSSFLAEIKPCHAFHQSLRLQVPVNIHLLGSVSRGRSYCQKCFATTKSQTEKDMNEYCVLPPEPQSIPQSKKKKNPKKGDELTVILPKYKKLSDIMIEHQYPPTAKSKLQQDTTEDIDKVAFNRDPWGANYSSSIATQKKIRAASTIKVNNVIDRAIHVLETILNTPPEWCNEANVVYALTLSAKCLLSSSKSTSHPNKEKQKEFRALLHRVLEILNELVKSNKLTTRQLANVSWAIAKHYSLDPMILPPQRTNPSLLYSRRNSMITSSERWNLIEGQEDNKNNNNSSEIRVLETLDEIAKTLIDSISGKSDEQSSICNGDDIKISELSMTCWAFSTIYPRSTPAVMGRMNEESENDNEIENDDTVFFEKWEEENEYSRSGSEHSPITLVDKLFDVIAGRLVLPQNESPPMTRLMSWKELSTVAWAYAHRGFCMTNASVTLMLQLSNEAVNRLQTFEANNEGIPTPRDVSEIAWALGISQTENYFLSDALDQFIAVVSSNYVKRDEVRPLQDWTPADCVQLAVAMAHGRLDDQALLQHIYIEAIYSLQQELKHSSAFGKTFQSWELSVMLWVQARLYLTKEVWEGFDKYAEMVPKVILLRMKGFNSKIDDEPDSFLQNKFARIGLSAQEKANLCWSLTVLNKIDSPEALQLVRGILSDAAKSCSSGERIRLEHAHQLWQTIFLLELPPDGVVSNEFIAFLRLTWDKEKARPKASSARHRALSQTLNFMGVKHYNEHDEDIDVAIVLKTDSKWLHTASTSEEQEYQTRVAVEFDGPAHFTRQRISGQGRSKTPPRALGHTVLKYKVLKKQGWTVIRVPFYEFDRIPFWASMERQRYLQRKLKTHSNIRFSGVDVSQYKAHVPNKQSRFD